MKYNSSEVFSLATALGFKNVSVRGNQVQFTCPFAEFGELSGHQHGDLRNPSFFVSSCPSDSNYTRWTCPVCEQARYNYAETKHLTDFYLKPSDSYDIVKRSYRTEAFLTTLCSLYTFYGYQEKAAKARSAWLEYIFTYDEDSEHTKFMFDPEAEYEQKEFYYFPESCLTSFTPVSNVPKALQYIESREVDPEVAIALDMRFDTAKNMLCFPMRDFESHDITGMRGRNIDPTCHSKDKHHWYQYFVDNNGEKICCGDSRDPWMNEDRIDFKKPVVVVEGIFDLLKVASFYTNVIAIGNKTVAGSKLARIKHVHSLVWLTDHGAAENDRIAVEKRCNHLGIKIYHAFIPEGHTYIDPDGTTQEVKDAGALPLDILIHTVMNTVNLASKALPKKLQLMTHSMPMRLLSKMTTTL